MQLLIVVAAVLIDGEGRVLLAQRPEGKNLAGLWEFPGGKIDSGERPEQALVRELHEELGVTIDPASLKPIAFASHAYDDLHLLMPLWMTSEWVGELSGKEGQALAWVGVPDLHTYAMPPADVPLIATLQSLSNQGRLT